jgi:6-pyruvoyltetrahydropterin/6-carboxytetrahydropterin synthase
MPSYLTRRVTFAAAHRYRRPDWSDEQNFARFGLCARENYHGHSYVCDVTVTGEIDPATGMIIDLGRLDKVLAAEVRERFDHRNINLDVPEFADGKLVPTGEELSRFIYERVQSALGADARVVEVILAEDATLSSGYRADGSVRSGR